MEKTSIYKPSGVCSREIHITYEGNIIKKVRFVGGCAGNLIGISQLVEGKTFDEVIVRLRGIKCGGKHTSCPDQLSRALQQARQADSSI